MRALLATLVLALLAGCLTPVQEEAPAAEVQPEAAPPAAAEPFHLKDRLWLPPSAPMHSAVTQREFELNATTPSLVATIHLGSTLPSTSGAASAMVELRNAAGDKLANAMVMPQGSPDAKMEAADLAAGKYVLRFETTGASDGQSTGQYLDYAVDA